MLIESECWRFVGERGKFGIYNTDPSRETREITFKVTEIKEELLIPQDIRNRFLLYESIFTAIDSAAIS